LMFPKHLWIRVMAMHNVYERKTKGTNEKLRVMLRLRWDDHRHVDVPIDNMTYLDPMEELEESEHLKDVCFVRIPGFNAGRNLSKLFISVDDEPSLAGAYLYGIRSSAKSLSVKPTLLTLNNCNSIYKTDYDATKYSMAPTEEPIYHEKLNEIEYIVMDYYQYQAPTVYGDCGMLLMHADSKLNSKILGVHVAGNQEKQFGLAIPVYEEDILDVIDYFGDKDVISKTTTIVPLCSGFEGATSFFRDVQNTDLRMYGKTGTFEGKTVKRRMPDSSNITASQVYDVLEAELGPATCAPACLKPFVNSEGERVSPMLKSLQKMSKFGVYIDCHELEEAVQHTADSIRSWHSPHLQDLRLLNEDEMINGYDGLNPIDISTSPGFPFVLTRTREGKKDYFTVDIVDGKHHYTMNQAMREIVKKREDEAREGVISETYWLDTLKDETRTLEKVELGKTRLFQVGPLDLVLLTRKYCGKFMSHCQSTYLEGEMAIGVNPYSDEWDLMCRRFLLFEKFLNGDFENYDASITFQLGSCVADVVNLIYDDGVENMRIRRALILSCFSTDHIVGDVIYEALQGHPSGCALTAILNCVVNMILLRVAFTRTTLLTLNEFHKNILAKFYGDDNVVGVSEHAAKRLDMFTFSKVMKSLGFGYTSPDKKSEMKKFYSFNEISFLTNSIVFTEKLDNFYIGKYLAVLDKETILEIARWSQSDNNNMMDQMNRFNMALYFMKNHGREEFDRLRKVFLKCIDNLRGRGFGIEYHSLFQWQHVMRLQHPEFKQWRDLTNEEIVTPCEIVRDVAGECDLGKLVTDVQLDSCYLGLTKSANKEFENENFVESFIQNVERERPKSKDLRSMKRAIVCQLGEEPERVVQEQITQFQENETSRETTEYVQGLPTVSYPPSLDKFILRPYLVTNINWSAADAVFSNKYTLSFPNIIQIFPELQGKLDNFAFWRPSVEITLRVNGTNMHYGRLIVYWLPQASLLSPSYLGPVSNFSGHFVQVDANGSNVATIVIPYTHYKDRINVGYNNIDLFTVYIAVAAPLSVVDGVAPSINCALYMRILEHNLTGYSYTNDWTAQIGNSRHLPPNLSNTNSFQIRQPLVLKCVDNPNCVVLGPEQTAETETDLSQVYSYPGETSIVEYCKRPGLLRLGTITGLQTAGTVLENFQLAPMSMIHANYMGAITPTVAYNPMPLSYVARMFLLWRGSFKFTISFIKSSFHNGRIKISYVPYSSSVAPVAMTLRQSHDTEGIVVDLSTQSEVSFIVPYQQCTDWLYNSVYVEEVAQANMQIATNGTLNIMVLNTLTAGVSPVPPIYYQIFVSACEDIQFAQQNVQGLKQSGVQAQIGEQHSGGVDFVASSMTTLMNADACVLGTNRKHQSKKVCVANEQVDLLDMSKMLSGIYFQYLSPTLDVVVRPYANFDGSASGLHTYFLFLRTFFRYMRGGIRVTFIPDNVYQGIYYASILFGNPPFFSSSPVSYLDIYDSSTGFNYSYDITTNPIDNIIPYACAYHCLPTGMANVSLDPLIVTPDIRVGFKAHNGTDIPNALIYMAGADDYQLGFQMPVPVCKSLV
jgi:hypothetical protein